MSDNKLLTLGELIRIALDPKSTPTERALSVACIYQRGRADAVTDFHANLAKQQRASA